MVGVGHVSSGEPSPWVWLRDGVDRLFHAVSVWELPPEGDGPTAVCGRRVQVVSLLDEPDGGRCPACVAATAPAVRERRGTGAAPTWVRLGVVTSSDPMSGVCVRVAAAGSGGGGAQRVGVGAVEPGRGRGGR